MNATRIMRGNCERVASSGMVFNGNSPGESDNGNRHKLNEILLRLIEEEMELSFRSQNCLNNVGIRLIGQLVQRSASELLDLKNFGRTSLREIEKILSEMGLTLEMNLDFPPWNGDGNGDELIQILSLQRVDGGFQIDDDAARSLGIDLEQVKQDLLGANAINTVNKQQILLTQYLLDRLEPRFKKDMPYVADLIKPHRKWLAKELS